MRTFTAIACAGLAAAACNSAATVDADDAEVVLSPVAGRPGAAYFSLHANKLPMRLASVTSPKVGRIELHDSSMIEGVMRMGPLEDTAFPPEGDMTFEQGGKHAMLFDIDPAVKPGTSLPLTFTFDNAPAVTVQAPVKAVGED